MFFMVKTVVYICRFLSNVIKKTYQKGSFVSPTLLTRWKFQRFYEVEMQRYLNPLINSMHSDSTMVTEALNLFATTNDTSIKGVLRFQATHIVQNHLSLLRQATYSLSNVRLFSFFSVRPSVYRSVGSPVRRPSVRCPSVRHQK